MVGSSISDVPDEGSLEIGAIYRRRDLHRRFGGNQQAGIVPCRAENVVLLFHTREPSQQFYSDGLDDDGIYWYSGEGTLGDMTWTSANRSVRDHAASGCELLLFERIQRREGLWQYAKKMRYVAHKTETRKDRRGTLRKAILFALLPAKK
jgi:5-methylcytosine-specific restriction enzyme A